MTDEKTNQLGAAPKYTEPTIEIMLSVKAFYHLSRRQT
jgi:hypothetical protein